MDILNIKIENFLIIGQADIDLSNRGLCRIAGENSDDTTSSSNGSGKSSIIEAIYWCLFGETLRNIKASDGVVNRKAKKNCSVVLEFSEEDTHYRVERYRKHSKHKNNLYLYINGVDSRGKDNRDTQKYIQSIIGMDKMSFSNSIIFGQGHSKNLKRFSEMTDAEKKETLEGILNLDVFVRSHNFVKDSLKTLEISRAESVHRAKDLSDQVISCEEKITYALGRADKFEEEKEERIKDLISQQTLLKDVISGLRERLGSLKSEDVSDVESTISQAEELLNEAIERKSKLSDAFMVERSEQLLIKKGIERDMDRLKDKVNALLDPHQVGETCEKCGQAVTEEGLWMAKDGYEFDIQDMTRSIASIQEKVDGVVVKYKRELASADLDIKDAKDFIKTQKQYLKDVTAVTQKRAEISFQLEAKEEMLQTFEPLLKEARDTENVWRHTAERYGEELSDLSLRVDSFEKEVNKLDEEIKYYKFWRDAFSRTGIRSYLLDHIVPFLNDRVGHYLDILTDGGIKATFNTVKRLSSGEIRDNFNLEVSNKNAADTYEGNSGGEKRRVDLGVALGFNDFLASRSGKRFNLLLLDEVFEGVDADGLYYVIKVLEDIARRKSSVFVITHRDELKGYFSDEILIEREDGMSYVRGNVAIEYRETIRCFCDKIVKFDGVVLASRLLDKWDLRTKAEFPYCRDCPAGRSAAKEWLFKDFTPKEEDES